jgi:hypothetical protein
MHARTDGAYYARLIEQQLAPRHGAEQRGGNTDPSNDDSGRDNRDVEEEPAEAGLCFVMSLECR